MVLLIEFHGYHSQKWKPLPAILPSQQYGFDLVSQAIDRGAVIVILRTEKPWKVAVPRLGSYARLAVAKVPLVSAVSRGNLQAPDFDMVCGVLGAPASPERPRGSIPWPSLP